MLSIGEFSKICRVSPKTLRYYEEIELIMPDEINPENGYRYYSVNQLETMLLINRLKSYGFSLEEIKSILPSGRLQDEVLYPALTKKGQEMKKRIQEMNQILRQMEEDIEHIRQGGSLLDYSQNVDVIFAEGPEMLLMSVRKLVCEDEFPVEYGNCFHKIFRKIQDSLLTACAPPMVIFHSSEYTPSGMDTEFAVPVKEYVTGTRDFKPGLCLKTVLNGSYSNLPQVYAQQLAWAEKEGYENNGPLFEIYVTDPSQVSSENELITEVFYPVKKKRT